jgi:hypothetical protein
MARKVLYHRRAKAKQKPSEAMNVLLKQSGNLNDWDKARAATRELTKALTESLPLRRGIIYGDILGNIFQPVDLAPGAAPEFPLDILVPGTEKDFVAYTIPSTGRIPERHIEGDYVMVTTYEVASSIDWALKFSRDARWDVVGRAMQILESGFVLKANRDGWHTLLLAGKDRNILVYDDAATAGFFSKRLINLAQQTMRRKAGGNSTSVGRGELTDLYLSPEALGDIRSWTTTEIDEFTRREIFLSGRPENPLPTIYGVQLHDIDELGIGQELQNYYVTNLGGTFTGSKVELAIGLDLTNTDSFVNPIRSPIEIFEDPTFHRQRRAGMYGWGEHGFGVLDSRRVLLLAL